MAGEWSTGLLADVAAGIQTGPFGSQLHASDYVPSGVPVVMPTNIRDRRIDTEGISFIGDDDADRLSRHKLRLHDLVFSRRGEVDKCALVTNDTVGWLCGTGCLLVRPDEKKCDPAFLSFHISAPDTREWLKQHAVGLVMPNLNTEILSSTPLNLPPLVEQRRIAVLLGSLDDKIELNRRMAATREEMARALFKSWFVDFDPVRAKAEGRDPGLPAATAALFPDSFGEDGLPEGWGKLPLGDLATLDRSTVEPSSLGDAVVNHYSLPAFDGNRAPIREPASSIKSLKLSLSAPIVLFSKLNPDTPRVWPLRRVGKIAVASTEFLALRPTRLSSLTWLTCLMSSDVFVAKAAGMVTGTSKSHQRVQPDSLLRTPWPAPEDAVMAAFEQVVAPLHERVDVLLEGARQLAALRDTLLPKLISGELRIKDMGKDVEAA